VSAAVDALVAPELREPLAAVPRGWKRLAVGSMYATATAQRMYAEDRLQLASPPTPPADVDLDVVALSCERDRLLVWRMVRSFLSRVGRPASFVIFSDGTVSETTRAALQRLSPAVRVVDFDGWIASKALATPIKRFAETHVLGKKIPIMMEASWERPLLYVDSDIEFLSGASRFRSLLAEGRAGKGRPRYQLEIDTNRRHAGYDERLAREVPAVLPRVSSGFNLLFDPLDWSQALAVVHPFIETPTFLTEQTTFAIAMTANDGEALPEGDYILRWEDLDRPWDRYGRKDVVMRHYGSARLRWKMWAKGGPAGMRALPQALSASLKRAYAVTAGPDRVDAATSA
jgi:hypothetical protein